MKTAFEREVEVPTSVLEAVTNQDRVDEAPHTFYKYPARFSPAFAREAIKAFTKPGETIIDPFCGGGTSLVEAISLGRKAAGFDISSLAVFLSRTKTSPLSIHDKRSIITWLKRIESLEEPAVIAEVILEGEDAHYQRNLPSIPRKFFETIIESLGCLAKDRQRRFARLALLATGQWALDCKSNTPTWPALRTNFLGRLRETVEDHFTYLGRAAAANGMPRCRITATRRVINRSSESSDDDRRIPSEWLPARLVITSPPYPGVHVVYHRWQINGRKETPAPFWLAGSRDGAGEAYYCLGRRREPELKTYFERLKNAFSSVGELLGRNSLVVQLVAFSSPEWQLPVYLSKMEEAGFVELFPVCDRDYIFEGRVWRDVPGRRWYAKNKGKTASSQEVMLLHRLRTNTD